MIPTPEGVHTDPARAYNRDGPQRPSTFLFARQIAAKPYREQHLALLERLADREFRDEFCDYDALAPGGKVAGVDPDVMWGFGPATSAARSHTCMQKVYLNYRQPRPSFTPGITERWPEWIWLFYVARRFKPGDRSDRREEILRRRWVARPAEWRHQDTLEAKGGDLAAADWVHRGDASLALWDAPIGWGWSRNRGLV